MTTDLTTLQGDAISLAEALELFPRRPHIATVWRWATTGLRGVRLETYRSGRNRVTTRSAVQRFLAALNADLVVESTPPAPRRAAAKRLQAAGA